MLAKQEKRRKQAGFLIDKNKEEEICYSSMSCKIIVRRKTDERGSNNPRQTHLTENEQEENDRHTSIQTEKRKRWNFALRVSTCFALKLTSSFSFLFEHLT